MVRLGDLTPDVLREAAGRGDPAAAAYDWDKYSEHQRNQREAASSSSSSASSVSSLSILLFSLLDLILTHVKNLNYDLFHGDPLLSVGLAIFVFMFLHKWLNSALLILLFALLVNVNPLYVGSGYLLYRFYLSGMSKPKYSAMKKKKEQLGSPDPQDCSTTPPSSAVIYDHILIGNDLSTYLVAAFLSRIGRRCCLLELVGLPLQQTEPLQDAPSAPLQPLTFYRPDRVNKIFRSLSLPSSLLRPVGSAEDGYCHTILAFPMDGTMTHLPLRPGLKSLAQDLATLPSSSPASLQALEKLQEWSHTMTATISDYVFSTISSAVNWVGRGDKWLSIVTGTTCSDLMHQIVEDSSVSVALRMLSLSVAEEPSAKFESLAGMNLMTALVRSVDGAYTIPGGFPVLRRSLTRIISAAGGAVFTNAPVSEIVLNETNARTTGVRIAAQGAVPVELELRCGQGIISGAGALATLTRLLPLSVSSPALTAARQKLKGLEEQRPKMAVVFWLRGSRDALGLSSCELVKLDASSEEEAGQGSSFTSTCRVWSPSARDETWDQSHPEIQTLVVELEAGEDLVRLVTHSDLEFRFYEPLPASTSSPSAVATQILQRAAHCVARVYPRLSAPGSILRAQLMPPLLGPYGGRALSSTVQRFLSKLTARTEIQGLYLCGKDIAISGANGEIMGALSAVSAVLGYSPAELRAGRNIVSDLLSSSTSGSAK